MHLFLVIAGTFSKVFYVVAFFFSKLIDAINGIRTVAIEEKFTELELAFGLVLQLFLWLGAIFV